MIIVMRPDSTEEDVQQVVERLGERNYGHHISRGESRTIIGAIGDMDGYQLPDAKGYTSMVRYLAGYSDDRRQQYREEIMGTTGKDFKALGELLEKVKETGTVAVLGSADAIAEANQEKPGLLTVKPVL